MVIGGILWQILWHWRNKKPWFMADPITMGFHSLLEESTIITMVYVTTDIMVLNHGLLFGLWIKTVWKYYRIL